MAAETAAVVTASGSAPTRRARPSFLRRFVAQKVAVVAAAFLLLAILGAALAPVIAPYPPDRILGARLAAPGGRFVLGSDQAGRDVLSRLIHGGQISLAVGLLAAGLSMVLGTSLGALRWGGHGHQITGRRHSTFNSSRAAGYSHWTIRIEPHGPCLDRGSFVYFSL